MRISLVDKRMNSLCLIVALLWVFAASVRAFSATSLFPRRQISSILSKRQSSFQDIENPESDGAVTRRQALQASALLIGTTTTFASAASAATEEVPIQASWTAVDGLNSNENVVSFDPSAYRAVSQQT
jgi:hypothetical protein